MLSSKAIKSVTTEEARGERPEHTTPKEAVKDAVGTDMKTERT